MKIKLIPEQIETDGYLPISSLDNLLVRHDDPAIIKAKGRWEYRAKESYEIVEVDKL
jgi:hypothetical protein